MILYFPTHFFETNVIPAISVRFELKVHTLVGKHVEIVV